MGCAILSVAGGCLYGLINGEVLETAIFIGAQASIFGAAVGSALGFGYVMTKCTMMESDFFLSYTHFRTPLMIAARKENDNMVKMLLQKGADPNAYSDDGQTALSLTRDYLCKDYIQNAINSKKNGVQQEKNEKEKKERNKQYYDYVINMFMQNGAKRTTNERGETVLLIEREKFNKLMKRDEKPSEQQTPSVEVVVPNYQEQNSSIEQKNEVLHEVKEDVKNVKTTNHVVRKTLLFPFKLIKGLASFANIHQKLSTRKAKDRIKNFNFENGSFEAFKDLINNGASVNSIYKNGSPILVSAAEYGRADIVRYLLDSKAWIDARNKNDEHALMVAVRKGHIELIELLVNRKADLYIRNKYGKNLFEVIPEYDCNTKAFLKTVLKPEELAKLQNAFELDRKDFIKQEVIRDKQQVRT